MNIKIYTRFKIVMRMNGMNELKFLICDMSKDEGDDMQKFFSDSEIRNVVFEPDITNLKKQIAGYMPDVIITGNHLWDDWQGIQFIMKVPQSENSQIIIWADTVNEKIMAEIFKSNNLHFVKKSDNKNILLETFRKVKPVALTYQ